MKAINNNLPRWVENIDVYTDAAKDINWSELDTEDTLATIDLKEGLSVDFTPTDCKNEKLSAFLYKSDGSGDYIHLFDVCKYDGSYKHSFAESKKNELEQAISILYSKRWEDIKKIELFVA